MMADFTGLPALHPAIRVLLLFCAAAYLPFADQYPLLLFAALLAAGLLMADRPRLQTALRGIWRIRWLLLSILILYGWFTPGAPIIDLSWANMPSATGLALGANRAFILILLVVWVQLLLFGQPAAQIAAGIHWVISPLKVLGLDTTRFANRLAMTLAAVPGLESWLREQTGRRNPDPATGPDSQQADPPRQKLIPALAGLIEQLETQGADSEVPESATALPVLPALPATQLLGVLLCVAIFCLLEWWY